MLFLDQKLMDFGSIGQMTNIGPKGVRKSLKRVTQCSASSRGESQSTFPPFWTLFATRPRTIHRACVRTMGETTGIFASGHLGTSSVEVRLPMNGHHGSTEWYSRDRGVISERLYRGQRSEENIFAGLFQSVFAGFAKYLLSRLWIDCGGSDRHCALCSLGGPVSVGTDFLAEAGAR